ncbi:MAG: hypothetical protein ABJO52_23420, partial [Nisaea sp.]|uniref:hypothetical protein n=1 Tax=Nisaea sp. TaxID=2024842 RepID=UPI00329A4EF5
MIDAVLSAILANFTQHYGDERKPCEPSAGDYISAGANPLNIRWGFGLRVGDPKSATARANGEDDVFKLSGQVSLWVSCAAAFARIRPYWHNIPPHLLPPHFCINLHFS